MALFPSTSIPSAAGGYDIDNSCRFNVNDSAKLTRTPSSAGNQKTWTISFWMKKTSINGPSMFVFSANNTTEINWASGNKEFGTQYNGGWFSTGHQQRDFSAWYHIVWIMDTTQATPTDRMKFYINGNPITSFAGGGTYPAQHSDQHVNNTVVHSIGSRNSGDYFDGYISEFHLVDGTALPVETFGEFDTDYGHWKAKKVTDVTYGTNGFHLDFKDSSNLGNDAAGSNNFTVSNLATTDQSTDSPTNNWCTLNPIDEAPSYKQTYTEGNLRVSGPTAGSYQMGTNGTLFSKNKMYYEILVEATPAGNGTIMEFGFAPDDYSGSRLADGNKDALSARPGHTATTNSQTGVVNHGVCVDRSYSLCYYDGASSVAVPVTGFSNGDIIQCAFDPTTGKFWYGLNNTWFGTGGTGNPGTGANPLVTLTNLDHTWTPNVACYYNTGIMVLNFGQDGTFNGNVSAGGNADDNGYGNFKYPVPAGFLAICSKNLPEPTIAKPNEHFNTVLWTGNGGTQSISSLAFQPDLVWIKSRSQASSHSWHDAVRGSTNRLNCDGPGPEQPSQTNSVTSFNSNGFSIGTEGYVNANAQTFVAWNWKANGTGSSNTDGSINTTATSANVDAGFSISTYTGNGVAGATIGHGLSVAPNLVIVKRRDVSNTWNVGSIQPMEPMDFTNNLVLNTGDAKATHISRWNNTAPTASVFSVGTNTECNASGSTYVVYCWHSVEGYSKIGMWNGNSSSTDGAFIACGFRPAFIWYKPVDYSDGWKIQDIARGIYNPTGKILNPESTLVESDTTSFYVDFVSNGFKWRSADGSVNNTNYHYLYIAFAETPFKYATAR